MQLFRNFTYDRYSIKYNVMTYYFTKIVMTDFDSAVAKVTEELKKEEFGIVMEIDMKATLKNKLNLDFRQYKILGACNPNLALKAISAEPHIGTMLPCNVVVQELDDNRIEITAVDPIASMMAIHNDQLGSVATEAQRRLKKVIEKL